MNAKEMDGEKAWRQLHKNAANNFEQVLEATAHKAAAVRPPTSHHEKLDEPDLQDTAAEAGRSFSDVLQLIPSNGRAKVGRPARTYIQQVCEDTGCSPQRRWTIGRSGERGLGISVLVARQEDGDDEFI